MSYNKALFRQMVEESKKDKSLPKYKVEGWLDNYAKKPIVNQNGYLDGEPPAGSNWRIPGNKITMNLPGMPNKILAVSDKGEMKQVKRGEEVTFNNAEYVDEYSLPKAQLGIPNDFKNALSYRPWQIPTKKSAAKPNVKKDKPSFEQRVNKLLGEPMKRAQEFSKKILPGEELDNARHYMAGAYANQAIQNKTGNIPVISPLLGWIGSNLSGLGHEAYSYYNHLQDGTARPLGTELRVSGEDFINNLLGATAASIFNDPKKIEKLYFDLNKRNLLPDGEEFPGGRNLYLKHDEKDKGGFGQYKNGGDISITDLEEGNWLNRYEEGGTLPKFQIRGLDNTYLPKPRVNFNYTQGKTYNQIHAEDLQRGLKESKAARNKYKIVENKGQTKSKDTRSWGSESRGKERIEKGAKFLTKASAIGQYFPTTAVPSIILNSASALVDARDAYTKGDATGGHLNMISAMPLPGLKAFNSIKRSPGLNSRQKRNVMTWGVGALGADLFGTASDLTDEFGTEEKKYGGWLDTFQEGGEALPKFQIIGEVSPTTLLTPKKIGEIRTVAGNLNEQKIYPENFKVRKMVYDPNCPDPNGLGCSYQAMRNAADITGLKPLRKHYPLGNAGYVQAIGERMGMQKIFEQEGAQAKYSNAGGPGWKYFTPKDYGKVKPGDIFLLDPKKGEDDFTYSAPAGFTSADLSGAPHVGVAVGRTPSGKPVISHGAAKGPKKGVNVTEAIGLDGSLSGFGKRGNYYIKAILRPSEIRDDNVIENIKYVTETGEERAKRKQETTSSAKFYLNPNNEQSLQNKLPVGYQFSGANVQQETKNKLINWFNDKSLDKELQGKFGISASELANIKPVVFGIAGQETTFNNVKFLPGLKDQYGNITNTGNSKGLFQIKYESLTPKERKIIGIKSPNDLLDDKKAYMAAVLRVMNSKKRMDSEIEQGTHPELINADPYFRAAYYYNSPGRAVSSAKSWAKGKDDVTWNPNTWTNKLVSRERSRDYKLLPNFLDKIVSAFAPVDPEYQKRIELRMDQGSYPFKVMQKAKELGVSHNFEEGEDLEEIVIHGTRKGNKNQRFVKYTKGGETNWLNNYK